MPHYYFDLHAGSLSEWDDEGLEAENIDEAVALAKDMLVVAIAHQDRLQGDRHAVVVVRDENGNPFATATATATATAASEAQVVWTEPSPRDNFP